MANESSGAAEAREPTVRTELSRDLGCFDVTMIGVGAMIGAGIFVLTGIAAGTAGPALILAFALNGLVTILTAMVYAELGSAIPEAGGGYLWIKEGLPGGNAFLAGWMSWFAHAVAGSLYALGFGAYLELVLRSFGVAPSVLAGPLGQRALAVAVALLFVYVNYRGVSETGAVGNVVTVTKIGILGVFVVSGVAAIWRHPDFLEKFTPFMPTGATGVLSAMGLTFIAFEGYEIIVQAGEEVRDPRRNIPRAIFWSLAIVIPIYLLVALASLGAVTPESGEASWQWLGKHAELGLAEAARQFMPFGTVLLLAGGLLSTMSALNATTFSSTRVAFAMGRDRSLPDTFGQIHARTRTPVVALLASSTIIMTMAVAVPIQHVAAASDIMFLLLFLQVNFAALTIRRKYGDKLRYGYVMPFFITLTVVGIATKLVLALFLFHYSPVAWYVALGWLVTGWGLWRWYALPRAREKIAAPVLYTERLRATKERFRILLPVDDPGQVERLARFATRFAAAEDGETILLHTLRVPRQIPPSAGYLLLRQARPAIDTITTLVGRGGGRVSSVVRMSHRKAWRSIVDTIHEYGVDAVVMGWRSGTGYRGYLVGRTIDEIVRNVNCDAIVMQDPPTARVARVLVCVSAPARAEPMLKVARLIASRRARIDLLHVGTPAAPDPAGPGRPLEALEQLADEAQDADPRGPRVSVLVTSAVDVAAEIIARAREHDAVIMGPERAGRLRTRLYGTTAQRVSTSVTCAVILVGQRSAALTHGARAFFEFFRDLEDKAQEEAVEAPPPAEGGGPTRGLADEEDRSPR
jgi:amino acid transporter/nucleotide-binding universal stress UspA family protein